MTRPTALPIQRHFEILEFQRRVRAADPAAGTPADGAPEDAVYDIVISTERAAKKWDGLETLLHERSAIDMSYAKNGLSFYVEHGGNLYGPPDPKLHVGIVEDIQLDEKTRRLRGAVRFSDHEFARQIESDFQRRTRPYVSVGYTVQKRKVTKAAAQPGDVEEYSATRWTPLEVSSVGIPADPAAMVQRDAGQQVYPVEYEEPETPTQERAMPVDNPTTTAPPAASAAPAAATVTAEPAREGRAAAPAGVTTIDRNAEVAEIFEFCAANGMSHRAAEFVRGGLSVDQVAREILRARTTDAIANPPAEGLDVPKRDARSYSFRRALEQAAEMREGTRSKFDGIEGELHAEIRGKLPPNVQHRGGILMPMQIERQDGDPARRGRAMGTGVAGGGAELVFDQAGDFIDLLRAKMLLAQFGAQVITGLTNPIIWPVQTGDPAVRWMKENSPTGAAQSQINFGTVTGSPKTMIGVVPFPRQLVNVASIGVEQRVRETLVLGHALAGDRAGFHGSGVGNEPLGLWGTANVGVKDFGSAPPTYGKLVDMQGVVEDKNADSANMAYITTPLLKAKMKQTQVAASTNAQMLWTGGLIGELAGNKAGATNQVSKTMSGLLPTGGSEHGIAFGDWSQIALLYWGALEVIVDPITLADSGQMKITTFQMADVVVLRPEAFCVSQLATLA